MIIDRCATCCVWDQFPNRDYGRCRRNAPLAHIVAADDEVDIKPAWPLTHGDDWCGQYASQAVNRASARLTAS